MEVGNGKLAHVALAREPEIAHLVHHDHLGLLLALEGLGVDLFEQLDGLGDAFLELLKGGLVVLEDDGWQTADALGDELGCVAAGLDLEREAGMLLVSRKVVGMGGSKYSFMSAMSRDSRISSGFLPFSLAKSSPFSMMEERLWRYLIRTGTDWT